MPARAEGDLHVVGMRAPLHGVLNAVEQLPVVRKDEHLGVAGLQHLLQVLLHRLHLHACSKILSTGPIMCSAVLLAPAGLFSTTPTTSRFLHLHPNKHSFFRHNHYATRLPLLPA